MALASVHQWIIKPSNMPLADIITKSILVGQIASIPSSDHHKTQFLFAVEQINQEPTQALVSLAWYQKPPLLRVGQRWQLAVKLRKPRNFINPGSYDYVNSLSTKHIYWTGYIYPQQSRLLTENTEVSWSALREQLSSRLNRIAPDHQVAGIINALTLNITTQISQADWDLFRRTGTTHLFGISGEHIALIYGLSFFIIRRLWVINVYGCLYIPAPIIASAGGLLIAMLYSFLAGFAPPVQRALIGCGLYAISYLGKKRFTPWQVWRYALFGVLIVEPHVVFMQGFYFSFLAVLCLLLTQQRWHLKGYKSNLTLQLSCLIGLMPLSFYWFAYGSINGFIANLFAIPLVSLLIVPLALLTMIFSLYSWSTLLMTPLTWLIHVLFKILSWTEHLAAINIHWSIHHIEWVLALLGALLLFILLPVKPFKYIAFLWFILPFFPKHQKIETQAAIIRVLDVGQGLAVSVHTKEHVLLYDTGDQFFHGNDFGNMVILPFYQYLGIKKIDTIVISHPDKDHRGGLRSIEQSLPIGKLLVNDPSYYHRGIGCHTYPSWQWDGVTFRFLPILNSFKNKNNNSCILQISTPHGKVLLTGDIEKKAEDYLVQNYKEVLHSDVLVIPHHGSKTSSSYRFLLEVEPHYAIASLGFANRFHFPHPKTVASFSHLGIPLLRTDQHGMIEIQLMHNKIVVTPSRTEI